MANVLHILRNEIYALVSRRSFWFGALGVPAIAFLIYAGIDLINRTQGGTTSTNVIRQVLEQPVDERPQGYIDRARIIREFPSDFVFTNWIRFEDEKEARQALDLGEISAYYILLPEIIDTGEIKVYTAEFNLISSQDRASQLRRLIRFNLLDGNIQLEKAVNNPLSGMEETNLSPTDVPVRDKDNMMTFFLPYGVMMFFYIAIMGSSGMLLNSVTKEKETRVMEILLVSVNAQQLLLGKIVGLGLVGLFQVVIWAGSALSLLQLSGEKFQLPPEFQLDPSILVWGIVFFILGYVVYAALMAGIGALVPNLREASQATTIAVLPMMIPLFLISALIESPNSVLSTILSIFPFTAPTTMMLRLAASPAVPIWQLLLSVALLVVTAYLTIRVVAGLFRAQNLLNGQPFNLKRFTLALLGRA